MWGGPLYFILRKAVSEQARQIPEGWRERHVQRPWGRSSQPRQIKVPRPWEELGAKLPMASHFTQNKLQRPESEFSFQWIILATV